MQHFLFIVICLSFSMHAVNCFQSMKHLHGVRAISISKPIQMGFFDSLFAPKRTANAAHILVSTPDAVEVLTTLKDKVGKAKNIKTAFADAAAQYSSCPSSKRGGDLGTFKQGQMVPAFDKVVFNNEIGVIHGPIKTPFGAHLILINEKSD